MAPRGGEAGRVRVHTIHEASGAGGEGGGLNFWGGVTADLVDVIVEDNWAREGAGGINIGDEVALVDTDTDTLMGTMKVTEKYSIDKKHECQQVFTTTDSEHPGVQKVMEQGPVNLAGPVKVLSESYYPEMFAAIYQRPADARGAAGNEDGFVRHAG